MAFEFIPVILFGLLFLAIGLKLSNAGAFGIVKLGLILGGIILMGWGIFAFWAEITVNL
jgi:hypothetical protein